jgi:hypothetical protein
LTRLAQLVFCPADEDVPGRIGWSDTPRVLHALQCFSQWGYPQGGSIGLDRL